MPNSLTEQEMKNGRKRKVCLRPRSKGSHLSRQLPSLVLGGIKGLLVSVVSVILPVGDDRLSKPGKTEHPEEPEQDEPIPHGWWLSLTQIDKQDQPQDTEECRRPHLDESQKKLE